LAKGECRVVSFVHRRQRPSEYAGAIPPTSKEVGFHLGEKILSELQQVPVDKLRPHPQNPRLVQREDVIASIETQLKEKGSFDPAHALVVRPVDDGYQIVMGHHRHTAAKRAGLDSVPCWVRTISDSEAFMLLATSNEQSDMTPLEWGMHALNYQGKLKEYAVIVGKAESSMYENRKAAEVLQYFNEKTRTCEFPQNSKTRTCEFLDGCSMR
jgi:ParB/RepB/Spo0J family partition protein